MGQATGDKELRTVSIPLSEFCWLKHLQVGGEFEDLGVSIPLSEFCWLKHYAEAGGGAGGEVSIPLSEFCWLKLDDLHVATDEDDRFNSPLGILLVEATPENRRAERPGGFNSPLGILLVEAPALLYDCWAFIRFQFPSRNSVG